MRFPDDRTGAAGAWAQHRRGRASARRTKHSIYCAYSLALAVAASGPAHAANVHTALVDLSLEELSNLEVTSVSKRAERLTDAAASIFVITADDIRSHGARSLPEALRLAPNLHVARTSASSYIITARGFSSSSANKLLVLIDGRSVYTPLFSGVFWDAQDVMLEDIERIEVVSGPGGTLWGTNAVNGVINIITRPARDTQGGLVAVGIGNREADGALRFGGTLGGNGHYRVYGKYFDRDGTRLMDGTSRDDGWHRGQVGFRADWSLPGNRISVHGNAYRGDVGQPEPGTITLNGVDMDLDAIDISGVNLTARWDRDLDDGGTLMVQAYYDRTERTVPPTFAETLDIVDVQFLHTLRPIGRHTLAWGAEYRHAWDDVDNSRYVEFLPASERLAWTSLFAQDEMQLREDLRFIAGARIEHNDYTGFEFLPNLRLAWNPIPEHMLWTAASRAVRSPSRLDRDTHIPLSAFVDPVPAGLPTYVLDGGDNVRSEIATVYELGYRAQLTPAASFSATLFRADYDYLRSQEIHTGEINLFFYANGMEGKTSGLEMWGSYQAAPNWRLSAGAMFLDMDLRRKPDSTDTNGPAVLGNDPSHQWQLRSVFGITPRHEFDLMIRRVGELPDPQVPAYTAVDARLGWQVSHDVELSLTLENLFDSAHPESGQQTFRGEYRRSAFLKMLWRVR
ncbi:MAG: TonB-dependent receptor plug domain-containing protein [Gammaproteobacteria bacterium]